MIKQPETVRDQNDTADSTANLSALEIFSRLLEWKKFIFYFVGAATIGAIIVSLLMPKWYMASVSLLPPKNQSLAGGISGLSALLREVAPGASSKLGGQTSSYSFLAILNSRRAKEAVIKRFNLMDEYDITDGSIEKAIREFESNSNIEVSEEGAIIISVADKNPARAAEMANYMAQLLSQISVEIGTGEARSNRMFLQKRLEESRAALRAAEDSLKGFQERHRLVALPEDAKSMASSIGSLYAKKIETEIKIELARKTVGSANTELQQLRLEEYELDRKLAGFPRLAMMSLRLYRDVIIQQKILEFLVPLYEQARFEEQKDIPVMVVLDKAVPPEKKFRPKRIFIVASSFLSSLMLSVLIVMVATKWKMFKAENPQHYERFRSLRQWKNKQFTN